MFVTSGFRLLPENMNVDENMDEYFSLGFCGNLQHKLWNLLENPNSSFAAKASTLEKLELKGQKLGRAIKSRSGCMHAMHFHLFEAKRPNLKLKSLPKQLLIFLLLDIDPGPVFTNHNTSFYS